MTTNKESNRELYIFFRHPLWRTFQHIETVNLLYKKRTWIEIPFFSYQYFQDDRGSETNI